MIWYILAGLIIIILVYFFRSKGFGGQPILVAKISSNDGFDYGVDFQQLHPDIKSVEYLRMILNFISKMYLISGESKEDNRSQIRFFLKSIADSSNLEQGLEKFKSQITLVKNLSKENDQKQIQATLLYKDMQTRNIVTKIPGGWYPNQFFYSILALIFSSVKYLDDHQQNLLYKSLTNLSNYYYTSPSSKSMKASFIFPNQAFLLATIS